VINPDDPKKLAEIIVRLYEHGELRLRLGKNARNVAKEKLDISISANKYDYFYKKITKKNQCHDF